MSEQPAIGFETWLQAKLLNIQAKTQFRHKALHKFANTVREYEVQYQNRFLDNKANLLAKVSARLQQRMSHDAIAQAFALVRISAQHTLNMRHYDVQLMGGFVMMKGATAEMETSEGKTLTATLTAATMALSGKAVHIITVNPYLAERDFEFSKPLFEFLGLTVSVATENQTADSRRRAYESQICYCTNKQVAFDHLHDRTSPNNPYIKKLDFALVDEADSVLIDDAKTPLIISRQAENTEQEETYAKALALAKKMRANEHFILDTANRHIDLTERGEAFIFTAIQSLGGIWSGRKRALYFMHMALSALFLYKKDHDYLVDEGKVKIIDQNTGRVLGDRAWEQGLHQLIEYKEGVPMSGMRETIARLTYQRFFRRYWKLSGMTGTGLELNHELCYSYHLPVVNIPTHKTKDRRFEGVQCFLSHTEKLQAIEQSLQSKHAQGQPVLLGTCSVYESERIAVHLNNSGLRAVTLNARQDKSEAQIIANAGSHGALTIATNMAGRGTDIKIPMSVKDIGGLHVLIANPNESRRIDRQLIGRSARAADPGSYEFIYALDDPLFEHTIPQWVKQALIRTFSKSHPIPPAIANLLVKWAQSQIEHKHYRIRLSLLKHEEELNHLLAFTGELE